MSLQIHLRRLLQSKAFLAAAILVLGLGLGVNLILFNAAYALMWRPLNFPQPDRLATIDGRRTTGQPEQVLTGSQAWTLRSQSAVLSDSGLLKTGQPLISLIRGDQSTDLTSATVDSGYFRVLALRPIAGRFFGEEEDRGETALPSAVLTESAWKSQFGSDPSVIGSELILQRGGARQPVRVIGIVPSAATLPFLPNAEILLPLASASPGVRSNSGDAFYRTVLRLRPGVSVARATAQLAGPLAGRPPIWSYHWAEPLRQAVMTAKPATVPLLYGAACLLLLLTCANLASLFAARALARTHETGIHLALGASRLRLIAANFEEALLVCAAGTAVAFLVESWMRPLVPKFIPGVRNVGAELLATSPALLGFGFLICLVVACAVCVASGIRFRFDGLAAILAQGGRSTGGSGAGRLRSVMAACQLAMVLTLLTISGMVGRSFLAAMRTEPGLHPDGVATFQVSLPGSQSSSQSVITGLASQFASVDGVQRVTWSAESPVGGPAFSTVIAPRKDSPRSTDSIVQCRLIGPSYFDLLGVRMIAGRNFSDDEIRQSAQVAILNEAAQRLLFRGRGAAGESIHPGLGGERTVVGVVKNIRSEGLDIAPAPMAYLPYFRGFGLRYLVRTSGSPEALLPVLRSRVRQSNPGVLLQRFSPLSAILHESVRDRMIEGVLVGGFALLGLIVSAVGLYGTLAAQVQQRRREFGVRIALGAGARRIAGGVLREGFRILALGAIAGLGLSAAAAHLIRQELFGVGPADLISFAVALLLLSAAALAACLVPALKAVRVDPIQTLNLQ